MMKFIVSTPEDNLLTAIELPDNYDMASQLHKQEYTRHDLTGSKFRHFHTDGLVLIDAQTICSQQLTAGLLFDSHVIAMVFHFDGDCHMVSTGAEKNTHITFFPGGHNIRVLSRGELDLVFEPNKFVNSFIVLLSKEFCLRVIPQEYNNDLLTAVENGRDVALFPEGSSLSQEMKRIVENVRNCSRKGSFHRLCLEIKIAELMMLQLEQYQLLRSNRPEKPIVHQADVEKIENAKKILEENYSRPPTIKELAMIIGVNETKLKTDFKKMYQRTIHEYTVSLRMHKAYQLITQQNLLLKEVALHVGYQKTSNFTKVFKEFYGISPKQAAIDKIS
ncbi:helix-turn-helix transcriptional regulator [Sphingobacterium sp. DN00404]|uniref:Helix-turn-helix transcriptional regulator n=1 Tax=Sphingobacterium micropteri TaxID=2763501 RepID=A0ABR7YJD9_9SPHI|nr:AraC family transcriptional regulator [Sphingobacterium micropteri]MBD1431376.1 helix-turn-helix transcriptional regulator [Sphingobacterium micropteri]